MKEITVDKSKLMETLEANRVAHVEEYNRAIIGWHLKLIETVRDALAELEHTEEPDLDKLNFGYKFRRPVSQEDEYKRAQEMLSWEQADSVVLSEEDFRHFVQDDWDWTRDFKFSASRYTAT